MQSQDMTGPLQGIRIVEFVGIGPGPFAAMMLADMGAEIVSIARPDTGIKTPEDFIFRGRRVVELDLKDEEDRLRAFDLACAADVVIEGFRPGVMERMGLGPDRLAARNRALVYARMTGWGQAGPLARIAGHDINYIALTGALDSIRCSDGAPVAPLNLVGDYGGGSLYLVVGVLAALIEARRTGCGQTVDAAICDGVSHMLSTFYSLRARDRWSDTPGTNILDGGAHFYGTYRCSDGKFIALGAIEPQFYAILCEKLGLDHDPRRQMEQSDWSGLRGRFADIVAGKTRAEWEAIFDGSDACFAPVLSLDEASRHPHMIERGVHRIEQDVVQPAPAPRFSNHPSAGPRPVAQSRTSAEAILSEWRQQA